MIRDLWNRNARDIKGRWPVLVLVAILAIVTLPYVINAAFGTHPTCEFERDDPGPQEGWWWEIYKCSDGTYRRQLVAGRRG